MSAAFAIARPLRWAAGILALSLLVAPSAEAVPIDWDGSSSRQWNTAANWTPAQIPTLADDVTFPQTATRFNPRVNAGISALTRTVTFPAGGNTYSLTCQGATTLTVAGFGTSGFTSAATTVTNACPTILGNGQMSVTGTLTLTGTLTATTLTKSGAGTLNINANSTGVGSIALNAGTILVGNTLTGTSATAASGTMLGGAGAITGTVTMSSGATLDPGTVAGTGNLDTGLLILNTGSTLAINFSGAATFTSVNVAGNATVAATVNLSGTTPNDGSYALVTASGTMTNGGVNLGTVPSGKAFGIRVTGNTLFLDVATVPIRIDNTTTASSSCTGALTWSHTVSGNDRYLVVGVSTSSGAGVSPTSVTYGGTALTLQTSDGAGSNRVFAYGLNAPAVGTANVVVNLPVTAGCGVVGGAMSFTGVNQTTPVGATGTNAGTASPATETISLTQGDRAVAVLAATTAATATEVSPATLRYRVLQSPVIGAAETVDKRTGGTTNTPVSFTLPGTTTLWSLSVVVLNAVAPTRDATTSAVVRATDRGNAVSWRGGPGLDVVGYRVWREVGGRRSLLTRGLVEGPVMQSRASALAGRSYAWEDLHPVPGVRYWLESLHTDGKTTWEAAAALPGRVAAPSASVALLGDRSLLGATSPEAHRGPDLALSLPPSGDHSTQWRLAAGAAAKLAVRTEGVYRVPAEALFAAGIQPGASVATLQLFRDGRQVPMDVQAADSAHLQPGDAVEFYGIGIDTRYTDTAVYWLVSGQGAALSLSLSSAGAPGPGALGATYLEARELRERLVWFGSAQNGDAEKFFGAAVFGTESSHVFGVDQLDPAADGAFLEVALQGITDGPHAVAVTVNGLGVGSVTFDGRVLGTGRLPLPPGLLIEGQAQVGLTSSGGTDISLESYVRLVYPRRTARGTGALVFSLPGGSATHLPGFDLSAARVLDVTNPVAPVRLSVADDGTGVASVLAPGNGTRRILAYLPGDRLQPAAVTANAPSTLHTEVAGADLVVLGPADLLAALGPLVDQRRSEGLTVLTVDSEDLRDEYAFGTKSAGALRRYLEQATTQWLVHPRFLLLAGQATYDPRDYLGLGGDRLSSGTVQTDFLEVASDHWFVDFPGGEAVAVGRLPVRTADEASLMMSKILARTPSGPDASVLLVADQAGTSDFQSHLQEVASQLPSASLQWIRRGTDTDAVLHDQLLGQLRQGPALVDYAGHGAETFWAGDLHTVDDAPLLAGSGKTSLYVHVTCLAGFFQDPRRHSLAVATLLTDGGGAWGAWATTGMSYPSDHPALNAALVDALVNKGQTLGEATRAALAATDDTTVQATLVLLGDPSARLAAAARSPAIGIPAPAPKTGCGAVDAPSSLLASLLAAAWLLAQRRRPSR